jgi:hypothetical protein
MASFKVLSQEEPRCVVAVFSCLLHITIPVNNFLFKVPLHVLEVRERRTRYVRASVWLITVEIQNLNIY